MKIYKFIYRLDFDIAFSIIDNLGKLLGKIHEFSLKNQYEEPQYGIDTVNHIASYKANVNDTDKFEFKVGAKYMYLTVEYNNGIEVQNITKSKLYSFFDYFIKENNLKKYIRIGMRAFLLEDMGDNSFTRIKSKIFEKNKDIIYPVKGFSKPKDIGVTFEFEHDLFENVRVLTGPYIKDESNKYFEQQPQVKEGAIIDIDIWDSKIEKEHEALKHMMNGMELMKNVELAIFNFYKEEAKNEL